MKTLLFCFRPILDVVEIGDSERQFIEVRNQSFARVDASAFNGFYDWLREKNGGKIIGVRYFVFKGREAYLERIRGLPYVSVAPAAQGGVEIMVFLGDQKMFDDVISSDQLFAGDYFFEAPDGTVAISFQQPEQEDV